MNVPDIRHFYFVVFGPISCIYILFILTQFSRIVDFSRIYSRQLVVLSLMFLVGFWLILTINVKNLDRSLSRFQTAKLANMQHGFSCAKYATRVFMC